MKTRITKGAICVLMVLLAANIFGIGCSQAQPEHSDNIINILGIDPTAYPKIKVNIFVDELCAATGNLVKDDFTVEEDGTGVAIDNFYFTGKASGQMLDLAVVFDETDTMADEIRAMKSNVDDLTNKIKASDIDARYSLVTFKNEVMPKIEWTADPEVFKREVNQLRASGGYYQRPEDSLGGVAKALSFGFRPDAQKIIIVITDEPSMQRGDGWSNSTYHQDDVQQELLDAGVMLVAVSPDFRSRSIPSNIPRSDLPLYADMRELAQNSGGLWIDIYSADFSVILDQLEDIITGTYVIEYTSPTTTTSGGRTVSVSVNAPDCVQGVASSTYMPPASATVQNEPPVITALTSDKSSPQEAGSVITWRAEAEDPDGDQVLYRFFMDDEPVTDWTEVNTWVWTAPGEARSYRIEVQARDGRHAGPRGMDSRKSASFLISGPNEPPTITTLTADKPSPQEVGSVIRWTAEADDPDGDQVLYRFFLDGEAVTDWTDENVWSWTTSEEGTYQIEVHARDGKHAGPGGMDDRKLASFYITGPEEIEVFFPDPNLRAAVRNAINKPDGPIYASELEQIGSLEADRRSIKDLTGLEYCTNLQTLRLRGNQITDVSPLAGLTNLQDLGLGDNQITDVSPLSGLTNLQYLNLRGNQITDVSPLAGLTNLQDLGLGDNQITDVSPLAGLTNLQYLSLEINQITDVSPLVGLTNLLYLALLNNQISDVSSLAGLTNLQHLFLGENQITDVSPLAGLTNLTWLYLGGNQITDVSPLAGLTNLQHLILGENQITDVSPLAGLTNLTWLNLWENQITDVSPLAGLTNLTSLNLGGNQITDVSPLAGLTNLTWLDLGGNQITDVSPLAGLTADIQ